MITLGADPEVFIFNAEKNRIVSVEGLIKDGEYGTKQNPLKIDDGYYLQEDGVLAEYNIPPCNNVQDWIESHEFMLNAINVVIPDQYYYSIEQTNQMEWEELGTEQTMEAGCEPDFNVWSLRENEIPNYLDTNLRSAGKTAAR